MTSISARAQARLAQGYAALAAGRWQEAERRGREAVSSRPNDPIALALLAISVALVIQGGGALSLDRRIAAGLS